MVVMGNPPYRGESANKGNWIMNLMEDYKKEPGGKEKLNERNPKWINDDYVKFIRYGQYFIEKNGEGVLAFINPHGFLDNPTFRGMRWNLLKTYDKIYTIDLHGNSKKKETAPDGTADVNVFDIQQGVSINFFVKTGEKQPNQLAKVYHSDLYGERSYKYQFLSSNSVNTIPFKLLPNTAPMYFMVKKNFEAEKKYKQGFGVQDIFPLNNVGIVTARDKFTIHFSSNSVKQAIEEFLQLNDEDARKEFDLGDDVRDWKVSYARNDLKKSGPVFSKIIKINYRPFDVRYTYYTGTSKGFHCYPRYDVTQHFLNGGNVGLALCRQIKTGNQYLHAFITNRAIESCYVSNRTSEITYIFPLYLYPDTTEQKSLEENNKSEVNLNREIVAKIASGLNLKFVTKKEEDTNDVFSPIDLLDYIYATLYSSCYRNKYKELLKTNFPRIPYPKNVKIFWKLVELGGQLRKIHLLETATIEKYITSYPKSGDNTITRKITKKDWELYDAKEKLVRVWINDTQCFEQLPLVAWEFYIGSYQPVQKWLKDRIGHKLSYDDIRHYQKIIKAIFDTHCLMLKISKISIE